MKNIKFGPKVTTALFYIVLMIVVVILFLGRTKSFLKIAVLENSLQGFYQHISNFSISYLLLSGVGFMWLMLGVPFKFISWLATSIVVANFVYEIWISVLNTPDIVDAYYGLAGTLCAFIFLLATKRLGLKENSSLHQ